MSGLDYAKIIKELFQELKLQQTQEDILAVMQSFYLKHPGIFKVEVKEIPEIVNSIPITDVRCRSNIIAATTKYYLGTVNNSKAVYIFCGERPKPKEDSNESKGTDQKVKDL